MRIFGLTYLSALLAGSLLVSSCNDEENPPPSVNYKSGILTADETWSADKIHRIAGKVVVPSGLTLTIEAGAIIKGRTGEGALASAVIVAQGGKINAVGTATNPIIFTSELDNIQVGESSGTNLDENDRGLWGGVLILGSAKISGDADTLQIEGIPADDTFGRYGGQDDTDNSGTFRYVSIRHGGALIGEGNEINGLTLGGVGSGTTIDHIEIVANKDDGIEPFGGTVNVSDIIVWAQGDDAYDVDQAYSGTINNFVYIAGPESDHAMEIDGPEGTLQGKFTLTNGTLKGNIEGGGEYADFRDGAQGTISNVFWWNFSTTEAYVEIEYDVSSANYTSGDLVLNAWEIVSTNNIDAIFFDKAANPTSGWTATVAPQVTIMGDATTKSVGADMSQFNWTYAKFKGALDDFPN